MRRKRMLGLIMAVAMVATGFAAAPSTALAGLGSCSGGTHYGNSADPVRWRLWARTQFEGTAVLCIHLALNGNSILIPNLKNVAYNYTPNTCEGQYPTSNGTWNDCIGSDQWILPCELRATIYTEANYGNLVATRTYTGSQLITPGVDAISSLKITYRDIGC